MSERGDTVEQRWRQGSHEVHTAPIDQSIASWLATLESPNTRAAYRSDLTQFARWCARHDVDPLDPSVGEVLRYRMAFEGTGARPASVARRLSAIGTFLAHISGEGSAALTGLVGLQRPTVEERSSTATLTPSDTVVVVEAADALHPKAALLVRLLVLDGLKLGEAVAADADDLGGRPPRRALRLRNPVRVISLHHDSAVAARAYLAGRRAGPLLLGDSSNRKGQRLTRFGADYVLKQVGRTAGLDGISANILRRTYVEAAHAEGADVGQIRRRLGHADERTTRRYFSDPG
jgi:integrase/recombinase XerD